VAAVYRVQQFYHAVRAWIQPEDASSATAGGYLSEDAWALFQAMPRHDRQHALSVMRALQREGHTDPDLLTAALLHDSGKTVQQDRPLRLWHRVAVVLLRAFWPSLLDRIAEDRPGSWRRPFYVQQCHAAIGAELAREAGCSPVTVGLIRHHEDPPDQVEDPLLAALWAADNAN
jgi:hypothetical protein